MLVVLQTKSKTARPQRIQLRSNQVAQFGRSDWADYSFAHDSSMSEVHFEVRCTPDGCRVRSLNTENVTRVNGEQIDVATVHDGDEIQAGEMSFLVNIEGDVQQQTDPEAGPDVESAEQNVGGVAGAGLTLVATCAYLDLSDDIQDLAQTTPSAEELIETLVEREQFLDALRLRAYLLPKREAVWWGCLCVRDELNEPLVPSSQVAALEAATAWVGSPDEDRRRDCEAKANAVKSHGTGRVAGAGSLLEWGQYHSPRRAVGSTR